jgi:hypothetical protein
MMNLLCHTVLLCQLLTSLLMRGHQRNVQTGLADWTGYARHIGRFLVLPIPTVTLI